MAKPLVFIGVLIFHWAVQFLAWSYAERSSAMRLLWNILATPLIHVAGALTNQYFWIIATANSLLWAAAVLCFYFIISRSHARVTP
jgi:hypothetical protein